MPRRSQQDADDKADIEAVGDHDNRRVDRSGTGGAAVCNLLEAPNALE